MFVFEMEITGLVVERYVNALLNKLVPIPLFLNSSFTEIVQILRSLSFLEIVLSYKHK